MKRITLWPGEKQAAPEIDPGRLPRHIAIIMDGNGRWARRRGLPRSAGHRAGVQALRQVVRDCGEVGIRYLTVYAFSTENWQRPGSEVAALMDLLVEALRNYLDELATGGVRIRTIGDVDGLPPRAREAVGDAVARTAANDGLTLVLALNYGGRREIAEAVRAVARAVEAGSVRADDVNEETFAAHLYTAGLPDPDLLIRPSGEMRLSNFLLWQAAYTEIWVTPVLWPDFGRRELLEAILAYQQRERRFGGLQPARRDGPGEAGC